jgi:hypothetical protein
MAITQIPIADSTFPQFSLQTDMDGTTYSLIFQWDDRFSEWNVSLWDAQELINLWGNTLIELDTPLFYQRLPGFLLPQSAVPFAGVMSDLTTLSLYYVDASELATP